MLNRSVETPTDTTALCHFATHEGPVEVTVPMVAHSRSLHAPANMKIITRWKIPLTVCYAMTPIMAQGSEFPYVVIDMQSHGDGVWLPQVMYMLATRGKKFSRIKFINLPALHTNKLCPKMVAVADHIEKEYQARIHQRDRREATLDVASMLENIVIRCGSNLDAVATAAVVKAVERRSAKR